MIPNLKTATPSLSQERASKGLWNSFFKRPSFIPYNWLLSLQDLGPLAVRDFLKTFHYCIISTGTFKCVYLQSDKYDFSPISFEFPII